MIIIPAKKKTFNEYEVKDNVILIKLINRKKEEFTVLVDYKDLKKLKEYNKRWFAVWDKNTESYYVATTEYLGMINGKPKYKKIYLHRFLFDNPTNIYIDHINYNGFDNRRINLRCTQNEENTKNRSGKNKNNKSGYRNVSWSKDYNKWVIQLQINGKNKIMGFYNDVEEAGRTAKELRQKYYGNYAGNS